MKTILILASNPRKDLNLDREIRDLKGVVEKSRSREEFAVVTELAVRVGDLQDHLLRHEPQIVHFCGHGSGEAGLVFASDEVREQWVQTDALSDLFRLCSRYVECVMLNACYSEEQANEIVNHIDYVIGMRQTIQDNAAIAFSKGFYRALGYNRPIKEAYEFGCNAIQLEITGSSKVRSMATEAERKLNVANAVTTTVIPEHLKPILKQKTILMRVSFPVPALSEETRRVIQLEVAESLMQDSGADQYRARVREFLGDRQLSPLETIRLERLRKDLRLSEEEANGILEEELEPIRRSQDEYEAMLIGLIEAGHYPFDAATNAELSALQRELGLTDDEVQTISIPIWEEAYEDYRAQLLYEQHQLDEQRRQQELEQQRQDDLARQQRAEESQRHGQRLLLKRFEFQVPMVNVSSQTIEKLGWFGIKTETINTCNITYKQGQAEYFVEDLGGGVLLEMVMIPGGTFMMGSPSGEAERFDDEGPQHLVTIQPLAMGKFVVTQAQWQAVAALTKVKIDLNPDPSHFKGLSFPVEQVSWHEAVEFCDRLSHQTGRQYRLPSEAEWEYACRAGTTTPFSCGETIDAEIANYRAQDWEYKGNNYFGKYGLGHYGEFRSTPTICGSLEVANDFGLYDMHGNIWEWVADHYHENYHGAPIDGSAWITDGDVSKRQMRGGSWYYNPGYCRSACRDSDAPDNHDDNLGFRVSCVYSLIVRTGRNDSIRRTTGSPDLLR
jgi:formylglycine-generating enzyme required for sulfatase activity